MVAGSMWLPHDHLTTFNFIFSSKCDRYLLICCTCEYFWCEFTVMYLPLGLSDVLYFPGHPVFLGHLKCPVGTGLGMSRVKIWNPLIIWTIFLIFPVNTENKSDNPKYVPYVLTTKITHPSALYWGFKLEPSVTNRPGIEPKSKLLASFTCNDQHRVFFIQFWEGRKSSLWIWVLKYINVDKVMFLWEVMHWRISQFCWIAHHYKTASDIIFGEFIVRNAATGRPIQVAHFSSKGRPWT